MSRCRREGSGDVQSAHAGAVRRRLQSAPAHSRREMWAQWGFCKGVMHGYRVTVALEIPTYAGFYRVRILQALVWRSVPRRATPSVGPAGERLDGRAYAFVFVSYRSPTGSRATRSVRPLLLLSNQLPRANITLLPRPDVIKSRIQLRSTPPTGTPVQYITREARAIVILRSIPVVLFIPVSRAVLIWVPESAISFDIRYPEVFDLTLSPFVAIRTIKSLPLTAPPT
ncbi:hypothetical protein B0H11DRAFT_1905405 [Mycena galericulata]|nr:hypothetical protein B0H11DRAFT_1905405 [Mycena galericulata]